MTVPYVHGRAIAAYKDDEKAGATNYFFIALAG
jgi:hypothetical protein